MCLGRCGYDLENRKFISSNRATADTYPRINLAALLLQGLQSALEYRGPAEMSVCFHLPRVSSISIPKWSSELPFSDTEILGIFPIKYS